MLQFHSVQSYFRNPLLKEDVRLQLDGSCTTIVVLVIWMCLRFGCRDPQTMVDAVRCAMYHRRTALVDVHRGYGPVATELIAFLRRLRAWHNRFADRAMTAAQFRAWLGISKPAGSARCHAMRYRPDGAYDGLCPEPCHGGVAWCAAHTPGALPDTVDLDAIPRIDFRILHLANGLAGLNVVMGGYFEHRWEGDDWACSINTMKLQLQEADDDDNLGTIRFFGFLRGDRLERRPIRRIMHIIENQVGWDVIQQKVKVLSVELLVPDGDAVADTEIDWFRKMAGKRVPLKHFEAVVVAVQRRVLTYASWMTRHPSSVDLHNALVTEHQLTEGATVLLVVNRSDQLAWLATLLNNAGPLDGVGFQLVFSKLQEAAWTRQEHQTLATGLWHVANGIANRRERIRPFTVPRWSGRGQSLSDHHLYLCVAHRHGVDAPDGETYKFKEPGSNRPSILVYVEDFLKDWMKDQPGWKRSKRPRP
jgi:hypothetical protein